MGLVIVPATEWADISSEKEWNEKVHFRINAPFYVDRDAPDTDFNKAADGDVVVRGPVYVGNEEMLDRHGELVDMKAIMSAWTGERGYDQNPVILYNHSKTYGVIGMMLDCEMGKWGDFKFDVPIGRAMIDGGEKDIVRKIRKGMLRSFSIGFMAKAAVKECIDGDEDNCYMKFTDIEWVETSVVDIPSSREALFQVEKRAPIPSEDKSTMSRDENGMENLCEEGCACNQCTYEDWNAASPIEHPEGKKDSCSCSLETKELANPIEPTTVEPADFIDPLPIPLSQEGLVDMADDEIIEEENTLAEIDVVEEPAIEMPSPTEALMAVTTAIGEMNARMAQIESALDEKTAMVAKMADLEVQVSELAESKATLESEKSTAEAKLALEIMVAERVAEIVKDIPQTVEVGVEPSQKSVKVSEIAKPVNNNKNIHDPSITVTPGMAGLSSWLEQQLVARGGLQR